jgi:hypothetical protein
LPTFPTCKCSQLGWLILRRAASPNEENYPCARGKNVLVV